MLIWLFVVALLLVQPGFAVSTTSVVPGPEEFLKRGLPAQALPGLINALETAQSEYARVLAHIHLVQAYQQTGEGDQAAHHLERVYTASGPDRHADLYALGLYTQGVGKVDQNPAAAKEHFTQAFHLAKKLELSQLAVDAALALSRVKASLGDLDFAEPLSGFAAKLTALGPSERQAALVAAATIVVNSGLANADLAQARKWLEAARDLAAESNDPLVAGYAVAGLARLALRAGDLTRARNAMLDAIDIAQAADGEEALYLWEWQLARIYTAADKAQLAVAAYQRAIAQLQRIRASLTRRGDASYRSLVSPIYTELAKLLLQEADTNKDQAQAHLALTQQTLEQLREAELVEYFENDCVLPETTEASIADLDSSAVVLYPILLDSRAEILVSNGETITSHPVQATSSYINKLANTLYDSIYAFCRPEEQTNPDLCHKQLASHLQPAQELYDLLLRDLINQLPQTTATLVVVPDGALRKIPLGVLHDGNSYLIQKYPIATAPGLNLVDPTPMPRDNLSVFALGVSEAREGFSALPEVPVEIEAIRAADYKVAQMVDRKFSIRQSEEALIYGRTPIVHIATHGKFEAQSKNSFLVAYDGRLALNDLERALSVRRYQEQPLELLVLSACETAQGDDDRAALGMAGLALKAGARSALASLWSIGDATTAQLMAVFYRELKNPKVSKAAALQKAQTELIKQGGLTGHPSHWAPYLLIGNWL